MKDLMDSLKDMDYRVRRDAVLSLKGTASKENTALLIESLGDDNETVSSEAIKILKNFGEAALPHLIGALKHSSYTVRRNAAQVLAGMGNAYLQTLLDLAKTNDDDIQFWISEVISQFGSRSVKTLVEIIEADDMPAKLCAISALGRTRVKEAVRPLLHCLDEEQWTIRKTAAQALIQLGQLAVDEVIRVLNCGVTDREFWAIQILGEISGSKARKSLISKLLSENIPVDQKQVILQSMRNMESVEVVEPLIQMLGDKNWFVRKQAADTLWELGEMGQEHLIRALRSKNTDIRYWSVKVLGDLQCLDAVPQICQILKNDSSWSVRASAALALGEMGYEDATLDLVDALRDSSEYVKKNAMVALNRIGEIKQAKSQISEEWVQGFTRQVFSDLQSSRTRGALARLKEMIRDVPDFPKPGVMFKDIGPLLASPNGLSDVSKLFAASLKGRDIDLIVGIESRGFLLGAALAQLLKTGFVPLRKKGKLPPPVLSQKYGLEYGEDELELSEGIVRNKSVIIIDDVLATGGTAKAACDLILLSGGKVEGFLCLIELDFLDGRAKLPGVSVESLIHY
ncbi:MAG: adenine phosphoribosyltransferase [Candidatus Cloacimonetes bacterium]|nr:adenine phosphoribosyltransferase [Candidatus Cloacimonadota bacterium]